MSADQITQERIAVWRAQNRAYGCFMVSTADGDAILNALESSRANASLLKAERDAAIDQRNALQSAFNDERNEVDALRAEVQRLTEEARRSDAVQGVEVPEYLDDSDAIDAIVKYRGPGPVTGDEVTGFLIAADLYRSRLSPSPQPATGVAPQVDSFAVEWNDGLQLRSTTVYRPSPQPSADVVVVPRVKLEEFVAWAIEAGEALDSYQTSRHMMDSADHARALADALRSSTNHDSKET